jgi:hypothetical protein
MDQNLDPKNILKQKNRREKKQRILAGKMGSDKYVVIIFSTENLLLGRTLPKAEMASVSRFVQRSV